MSIIALSELTRHGTARRATVSMGGRTWEFEDLGVWIDVTQGMAHLLDADMSRHLATAPIDAVFVEWEDIAAIERARHIAK